MYTRGKQKDIPRTDEETTDNQEGSVESSEEGEDQEDEDEDDGEDEDDDDDDEEDDDDEDEEDGEDNQKRYYLRQRKATVYYQAPLESKGFPPPCPGDDVIIFFMSLFCVILMAVVLTYPKCARSQFFQRVKF